jgi:tRNA pseudouridine13 synthase
MSLSGPPDPWPLLTADLPGIGGTIREHDEDFIVEEIPRYPASGEGTHVFFQVEKRGLGTMEAIQRLAKALGKPPRDFGYAGLKDARGVTRQFLSIEHVDPQRVRDQEIPNVRILSVARHGNKLKLGHHAGNRFDLRIRGADLARIRDAEAILDVLRRRGVPNYFGPQRFGARGTNGAVGAAALRADWAEAFAVLLGRPGDADEESQRRPRALYDAGDLAAAADAWPRGFGLEARACRAILAERGPSARAWQRIDQPTRRLFLSAFQAELFNRVLAERLDELDRCVTGDLAWLHRNGACFLVEDASAEQHRCETFEISPTGPVFGGRMTAPQGEPAEREARILAAAGLDSFPKKAPDGTPLEGARRPLRVLLADLHHETGADDVGTYLRLCFSLPPGSYATAVTREICR